MISSKWLQGVDNIGEALEIRKIVFVDELGQDESSITDIYDEFAFSTVLYESGEKAGTGRILFKDLKYVMDNVCVIDKFRHGHMGELIIRLLVRRAVDLGAKETYAVIDRKLKGLFDRVGFETVRDIDENTIEIKKVGDVGGHCCG